MTWLKSCYLALMSLFKQKRKNCDVTFIEENVIVLRGVKYHHHDHELQEIKKLLSTILKNQIKEMAKSQERFDALMARLDAATNDIATDYKTLLDAVQAGDNGISEESFAKHEANIAKLEALGASVDNPVPEQPPVDPNA